jgi:hypothetical protein
MLANAHMPPHPRCRVGMLLFAASKDISKRLPHEKNYNSG